MQLQFKRLAVLGAMGLFAGVFSVTGSGPASADEDEAGGQESVDVVISEVKTQGAGGSTDEFVEIANRNMEDDVSIGGWQLIRCSSGGSENVLFTFPAGTTLERLGTEGSHYLVAGQGYTGPVEADTQIPVNIARNGGVMLKNTSSLRVDGVAFSSGAGACLEGSSANPASNNNPNNLSAQRNQVLLD
ncbi:MAG: lamin tail domain-containing protein, partial [Stackebrandtia sp.]